MRRRCDGGSDPGGGTEKSSAVYDAGSGDPCEEYAAECQWKDRSEEIEGTELIFSVSELF